MSLFLRRTSDSPAQKWPTSNELLPKQKWLMRRQLIIEHYTRSASLTDRQRLHFEAL